MAYTSLREYVAALEDLGQVRTIEGADAQTEIGGLAELAWEQRGPATLFDRVKGYPAGMRIVTNLMDTLPRCAIAIGLPPDCSRETFMARWKEVLTNWKPVPPREISAKEAPVFENRMVGDKVDLMRFPVPKWHELDGGPYIGTGVVCIYRDPDPPHYVNLGCYRVQLHDGKTLGAFASPGRHGRIIREKHWAKGENCPVVLSFGQDPSLWISTTTTLPYGVSEYDLAGYLLGQPEEYVRGPITGLPVPAHAEMVIEGELPPPSVEQHMEGPFGEAPGYYSSGEQMQPVIKVKAVYWRNNPIHHGEPPFRPPSEGFMYQPEVFSVVEEVNLRQAGITDVRGVACYAGRKIRVISLKQRYLAHAKEAAIVLLRTSYGGGAIIVVDDDIDPWNPEEVAWAVMTRMDPVEDMDIVRGMRSTLLDSRMHPDQKAAGNLTAPVMVINACRPYHWKDRFPPVNMMSDRKRAELVAKWGKTLGINS